MINPRELRIGNNIYVCSNIPARRNEKYFGEITGISKSGVEYKYDGPNLNHCTFEPIPITEEWLIKLGFVKHGKEYIISTEFVERYFFISAYYRYETGSIVDGWEYGCYNKKVPHHISMGKYIHQLQNLYFSLTGEELELKEKYI